MSEAFKRAGILYGKLGLTTPATLIEGRYPGIKAAAEALTIEQLPELLLALFGKASAEKADFLEHFSASDPTFDVRPTDTEAALLAAAVADYAMTEELDIASEVALSVTTAAVGGIRSIAVPSNILLIADEILTAGQEEHQKPPAPRKPVVVPAAIAQQIENIKTQTPSHQNLPAIIPAVTAALEQLQSYVTSASKHAANCDNALLAHIAKLEEETRIHWWVVGGWSVETDSFFRDLDAAKAAIQAGWELAGKISSPLGLHAAPALLDMVIGRGRDKLSDITLAVAAKAPNLEWRKTHFGAISGGGLASLLPISTMLELSSDSGDEDDWKPAFTRKTGLDPETNIAPLGLAVQIYRERLVRKLFKA